MVVVLVSVVVLVVVYLSIYLPICNLENEAILRDFLNFELDSNSARLPQFLHLTTSKTKQFCETSFKNGKLSAEL